MKERIFTLALLLALTCGFSVVSRANAEEEQSSEETISQSVPRIEDYADQNYRLEIYQMLEAKLSKETANHKDWAFATFVMDRKGKIEKAVIANSTGNEKLNLEVIKILHETHLPPLPEDCPDQVRATHAFNYYRATHGMKAHRTESEQGQHSNLANSFFNKSESSDSASATDEKVAAMKNTATSVGLVVYAFIIMAFLGGGSIFAFFIALPVWFLHRLFTGRYPA